MRILLPALLVFAIGASTSSSALARRTEGEPPIIVGLAREQALRPDYVGNILIGELGCANCHDGLLERVVDDKQAPRLGSIAGAPPELRASALRDYIAEPRHHHPGTTMPDVLHHLPNDVRQNVAKRLADFLTHDGEPQAEDDSVESDWTPRDSDPDGKRLFESIGCLACHDPEAGRSLAHVADKFRPSALAKFLFDPLHARASGRMPDMLLSASEARGLAAYLTGEGSDLPGDEKTASRSSNPAEGRAHFREHGCANCHAIPGIEPKRRTFLEPQSFQSGCLSDEPSQAPRYDLSEEQRFAIRSALFERLRHVPRKPSDEERIQMHLLALGCVACHERGELSGIPDSLDHHFQTTQPDLGDEARIPPPLTGVGAKLTRRALEGVLFEEHRVRPYMKTRMPQYAADTMAALPDLFDRTDHVEPYPLRKLERDEAKEAREAGRELLGNRGLACIACHNFGGKPSPNFQGMDLLTFPERLRPDWFAQFIIAPQKFRPGIVMPESWSGGIAAHQGILAGDTTKQIEAIWHFLSLGTSARNPFGISPRPSNIDVTDRVRTYRGRSRVAGFRGIAVGYPGGLNYAFNAKTGTLSALWSGDFVSARWDGQGAGDFHPRGRPVQLAQDVSFVRLANEDAPWPLAPVTTDENPVDPDPLYPRNHGFRFRGYSFDDDDVPTFHYESNGVRIEDRSFTYFLIPDQFALARVLQLQSDEPTSLEFRALSGDIEKLDEIRYRLGDLTLSVMPGIPHRLRSSSVRKDEDQLELLLSLEVTDEPLVLVLHYELAR